MKTVETLIKNLRSAFAETPRPKKINECACDLCLNEEQCLELLLLSDDIELVLNDRDKINLLEAYIGDAIWTVGNKLDFKYFAPKLLELYLHKFDIFDKIETFTTKLELAGFNNWTTLQRHSIEAAIYYMVDSGIKAESNSFDSWICGLTMLDVNHQKFLNLLDHDYAAVSRDAFIKWHYPKSWAGDQMKGPYWDDLPKERTEVVHNWLVCQPPL